MVEPGTGQHLDGIVVQPNDVGKAARLSLYRGGEELSRTWIVPLTVRIGRATVRMDGIGGVATPEDHRNQGYSRQVLTAAVEHMKAGDAALTALYGIPHYYPRWGYATAAHEHIVRLRRLDADNVLHEGLRMRAATRADLARIRTIYDDATRTLVGPVVREADGPVWRELATAIGEGRDACRVVVDDTDEVLAYAWTAAFIWWMENAVRNDPDGLHIGEAFALTPRAADALLAGLRGWTAEAGKAHIDLHQPPIGALGMAARLQDTETRTVTFRDAEFMARSVGTRALIAALEEELRDRWRASRLGWRGTLRIVADDEAVNVALGPDALALLPARASGSAVDADVGAEVALTPGELARLALGSFPPLDLLDRIGVARDIADVLAVLFPERQPYLYPADRF